MATSTDRSGVRPLRQRLRQHARSFFDASVPVGRVRWGALRRNKPFSVRYGYDRGTPIDRFYIEPFLRRWSGAIKGSVLEIKEPEYTQAFGGARVKHSDVLDIDVTNRQATIFADLNEPTDLSSDAYDCVIFTQTLQYIYRTEQAMRELHRVLKPGGVLLMTVPGITPSPASERRFWTFTQLSVEQLLGDVFGRGRGEVSTHGNLLAATAFLYGLSGEDMRPDELDVSDPDYPVIISARFQKAD